MKREIHKRNIELSLAQRDYILVESYHTSLLENIESAIQDGFTVADIMSLARRSCSEAELLSRIRGAATYAEWLMNGN